MNKRPSHRPRGEGGPRVARWAFWGTFAIALLLVVFETANQVSRIQKLTALESGYTVEPVEDRGSISGFSGGMRHLIVNDRHDDLAWVINVQTAAHRGDLRLREIAYDNAPEGRSVHWSSVYAWWIRMVARVDQLFSNDSYQQSIERAAYVANLALCLIVMLGVAFVVSRDLGYKSGSLVIVGFLSILPFRDVYRFGMGDHHAAAILMSLLCIVFLLLAMRRCLKGLTDSPAGVMSLCVASGLFGGLGLWINAISQLPFLIGVHIAGAALLIGNRRAKEGEAELRSMASVWRWWSVSGAVTSFIAYLLEYAPNHLGMRLEVNHPLMALAWLGGGELLRHLNLAAANARDAEPGGFGWRWLLPAAAVVAYPTVAFFLDERVFRVADPFLMAIHQRYIMEFQPLATNIAALPSGLRSFAMLLPSAVLLLAAVPLAMGKLSRVKRSLFIVALGPAVAVFALTLWQARWWAQASALAIPILALLAWSDRGRSSDRARRLGWSAWLAFGCLLPGLGFTVAYAMVEAPLLQKERLRSVERGIVHYLRARSGDSEMTVLASPDATLNACYFGGVRGLGTFYWENVEGLRRAAAIFAETDVARARELVSEAGVSAIVLYSWGGFEGKYVELHNEFTNSGAEIEDSLLMKLLAERQFPLWLRPIPFRVPGQPDSGQGDMALLFEVVGKRSGAVAAADKFEYFLEMGWRRAAFAQERVLSSFPESLVAQVSLARLYAVSGQERSFRAGIDAILKLLPADESEQLAIEFRVRLAGILAAAGDFENARSQFSIVLRELDEASLRTFYSDTVMHLLELERALGLAIPDPDLRVVAVSLLPDRHKTRLASMR